MRAVGDPHYGTGSEGILKPGLEHLPDRADLLLLAGDLTRRGNPEEVEVLADELRGLPVPIVAVLGNHDYHCGREAEVRRALPGGGGRWLRAGGVARRVYGGRGGDRRTQRLRGWHW